MLAVIETHPVQYHAPVYRAVEQQHGVPVTAIYGSDFSLAGYRDADFATSFAWDTDLVSGYRQIFLSRVAEGGPRTADTAPTHGLRAALRRLEPRVILVLGYSPRFHRVAWFEALRTGLPVLFRGEASDAARTRSWLKKRTRAIALRHGYARCARILYIGEVARQHYRTMGVSDDRLVFSPYCVDALTFAHDERARARLRAAARRELDVADEARLLLFSGKLTPIKAPELLVDAVRGLPDADRRRTIVAYVGDGPGREQLMRHAASPPAVSIRLVGFRNQRDLSRYYHAADAFVLPSLSETWGLVVNEALLHGVPAVVSSAVGAGPDLIRPGRTGEVFETGSAASLSAALARVRTLERRADVRDACRARADRYSVSAAAGGIAEAYAAVLSDQVRCA